MKVKEFIEKRIKELITTINYIEVFYEYKETSETHFIKISPKYVFDSKNFSEIKARLTKEFFDNNFSGLICFISDDSIVRLSGPTKIFSNYEKVLKDRPIWSRFTDRHVNNEDDYISQNCDYNYSKAA
jgi:hypothetical protein